MSKPLLRDVAAIAGVSMTTASLVLTDHPGARISLETRSRVRAAAEEVGYRTRKREPVRRVVGLVLMGPRVSAFSGGLLGGVVGAASEWDRVVAVIPHADGGAEHVEPPVATHLWEGFIQIGDRTRETTTSADVPRVVVEPLPRAGRARGSWRGVVVPDDHAAASALAERLGAQRHRRVAVVAQGAEAEVATRWSVAMGRSAGGVLDAGVTWSKDASLLASRVARLLDRAPTERPTALVCMSEESATTAYGAAAELGLGHQDQVWIAARGGGVDPPREDATFERFALPAAEMGRVALELLVSPGDAAEVRRKAPMRATVVPFPIDPTLRIPRAAFSAGP